MNDRDCKTCARSSINDYGGNGCTAWKCDYINRREAIDAWLEKYRPDQPAGGHRRMAGEVQTGSTGGRPGLQPAQDQTGGRYADQGVHGMSERIMLGGVTVWQMTWDEYEEEE